MTTDRFRVKGRRKAGRDWNYGNEKATFAALAFPSCLSLSIRYRESDQLCRTRNETTAYIPLQVIRKKKMRRVKRTKAWLNLSTERL